MKKISEKLKSRALIRLKGLNQERALNNLSKKYNLYNINSIDKALTEFEVEHNCAKQVKADLIANGFEANIVKFRGLAKMLKIAATSYGIITALLLCGALYCLQFGQLWSIKVYGTEKLNQTEIVEYVHENFSLNKAINTKNLESNLRNNFKQISSVSAAIVGQTLIININEKTLPSEMQGQFSPIYAGFDGRISQISLVQGTLAVEEGDIVQKGDVLVYPYILDSHGERRDCLPRAEIIADVWLQGRVTHSESYYRTYKTGNKKECSEVLLFGLQIYSNNKEIDFESYEMVESENVLSKNNLLPLIYKKYTYYETASELVEQTFDEVKEQKIEEAKQKALIYFLDYDIIKDESINIESLGAGQYQIDYVMTISRQIGVTYEDLF